MNYADMTPQQKRDFGFIKLNKDQLAYVTQPIQRPDRNSKRTNPDRTHLKLVSQNVIK